MVEYYPIYGDFKDGKQSTIIQFYAVPADSYLNNYHQSKTGIYSWNHARLYESYDMSAFKDQRAAEYNALRNGLVVALREGHTHVVLHTNASKLIENILAEVNADDEDDSNSISSNMSIETHDLHDIVMDLLYECDSVGFHQFEPRVLVEFEQYVSNMLTMTSSIKAVNIMDEDLD